MWRRTRQPWLRPCDLALNALRTWGIRSIPPDHLLREVFETCKTFGEARHRLETTPIARPAIFVLAGCRPGERCVIERTENDFRAGMAIPSPRMTGCEAGCHGNRAWRPRRR